MYTDVPAIELGAGDYSTESFRQYDHNPPAELNQCWRSTDSHLYSPVSFQPYQTDTSAHLANMQKRILNLSNAASGDGRSPFFRNSLEDSPTFGLAALRKMRPMSPNRSWGGSLSSTNSTSSDCAFSPDISRHHASLFCNDLNSQASFGSPYPVPFVHSYYSYSSQESCSGPLETSPRARQQAHACTMKELQYNPDPENDEILDTGRIVVNQTRPELTPLTPESCCLASSTPSRSEYDDSRKDASDQTTPDSGREMKSPSSRCQRTRRFSSNKSHPARSPTLSRVPFMKPTMADHRILKSSHRQVNSTKKRQRLCREADPTVRTAAVARSFAPSRITAAKAASLPKTNGSATYLLNIYSLASIAAMLHLASQPLLLTWVETKHSMISIAKTSSPSITGECILRGHQPTSRHPRKPMLILRMVWRK